MVLVQQLRGHPCASLRHGISLHFLLVYGLSGGKKLGGHFKSGRVVRISKMAAKLAAIPIYGHNLCSMTAIIMKLVAKHRFSHMSNPTIHIKIISGMSK